MSHFTYMKTSFQNLFYLEKALNKLNIVYTQQKEATNNLNLVISQSNGYDIKFEWNEQEYELIADMSFWEQPYPVESFIEKVAQQYAGELIIGESQKIGFQVISFAPNADRPNTLILERWNTTSTKAPNFSN